ncbi:DUF4031 domain-containing protein [Myceligenerans xiligouense]|uniref:Putative metal-dependent HD superfamily phosphohydrolase n=1 Tax=Myceligenerans xiligouense TaxID=253184 RepID=A0A3N4YVY5_9MICO|nr:DUF4031 domain-containing protein [Myceligenerans xiligouense]RPF22800.1 putative metal-dependent HD superfamily phosphohydrolase [Myceligenerans xiligouense]
MTILIDPPAWPAHGTVFSHLVSDTSLIELRTFARGAGVPDRAFDLDHYDIAAFRHDDLVAAGAVPVEGGELARRLLASGLRVRGGERAGSKREALLARWDALRPTPSGAWHTVGVALDARWREPHRAYHTAFHLAFALDALDLLLADAAVRGEPVPGPLAWRARVALWFHDAVHDGATPADEEASAALVHDLLGPLGGDPDEIARLVLVTAGHAPDPDDLAGCLVSDADLAILGSGSGDYVRYAHQVRAEYAHVPDALFRQGRARVLESLLATDDLFRTPWGRTRWQARAATNLATELTTLTP